jgi:hypothetical protein
MKTAVNKLKLTDIKTDYTWWQSRSYAERLATLEEIREEYNLWRYDNQQGFQRVYSVLKRS